MGKRWALGSRDDVGMPSRPNFCIWQYVCPVISRKNTLLLKPLASVVWVYSKRVLCLKVESAKLNIALKMAQWVFTSVFILILRSHTV